MSRNSRLDPANSPARCVSDNGDFPVHMWTWEDPWTCGRCDAASEGRTVNERPCASCANPYQTPYCGYVCGGVEPSEVDA